MRPLLDDPDPRIRATAAVALAGSAQAADVDRPRRRCSISSSDTRDADQGRAARRGARPRQIADPRFRPLLVPLMYDPAPEVADEAMESVHAAGASDFLFVPPLVVAAAQPAPEGPRARRARRLRRAVVDPLAYFMRDPDEDIWVRRHIPGTLAQIPSQKPSTSWSPRSRKRDGFLRYKASRRSSGCGASIAELTFTREPIEKLAIQEARRSSTP